MKQATEKHPPGPHGELHDRAPMVGRDFNQAAGHHRVGCLDYCVPTACSGCGEWRWVKGGGCATFLSLSAFLNLQFLMTNEICKFFSY